VGQLSYGRDHDRETEDFLPSEKLFHSLSTVNILIVLLNRLISQALIQEVVPFREDL